MTDKKKILIWITRDLLYFGIASSLLNKTDYDIYAIIEVNEKPKKFFIEQNIVKFKKVWFLDDHIKVQKKKPDLNYLKSFEEQYAIRLWKIAYFEKLFLKYNKYHKFSHDEILSLLEDECKFFEKIINEVKPDYFSSTVTDSHDKHLLYEMCKSKGIKILMSLCSKVGYNWVISETDILNLKNQKIENQIQFQSFDELRQHANSENKFKLIVKYAQSNRIQNWLKPRQIINILQSISFDSKQKLRFDNYGKNGFNVLFKMGLLLIKSKFRKQFIDKNFLRTIPKQNKFIYFPLIFEPGRILLMGNYFYTNQLDIIENIAKSLPVDFELFIKEAPGQKNQYWREINFYKKILNLPNVKLIHPSVNHYEMIKNASLVISITDSYGIEAAFYEKPSIVFGPVDNSDLRSIYKINQLEDLPKIIKSSLKEKVHLKDVSKFMNKILDSSFDANVLSLNPKDHPFSGYLVPNVIITNSQMEKLLKNRKSYFDIWADKIIKKIQSFSEIKPNGGV
jgi:hypothetical protein